MPFNPPASPKCRATLQKAATRTITDISPPEAEAPIWLKALNTFLLFAGAIILAFAAVGFFMPENAPMAGDENPLATISFPK